MLTLELSKPIPTDWSELKAGEEKTIETTISIMGFDVPLKLVGTRLDDQTVQVPAGTFADCQHVRIITHSVDQTGSPTKAMNEYWYHPKANAAVKEVFVQNYQAEGSYTGTSVLKSHTK